MISLLTDIFHVSYQSWSNSRDLLISKTTLPMTKNFGRICEWNLLLVWPIYMFIAYHTSRYINIIACACQVLVQFEHVFCFLSLYVKHMEPWICCVFHGNHKVHSAYKAFTYFWFTFVSCLKEGACSSLVFAQLW